RTKAERELIAPLDDPEIDRLPRTGRRRSPRLQRIAFGHKVTRSHSRLPREDYTGFSASTRSSWRRTEHQHGVEATECERVRHRVADLLCPSLVRHVVEIAIRIRLVEADRGRQEA